MRIAMAGLVLVLILTGGGLAVLTSVDIMPPVQKVEHVIPDEHFPR